MRLAERLAPSAGLRNRLVHELVHEYDRLDPDQVLGAVKTTHELYPQHVREIEDYLSGRH